MKDWRKEFDEKWHKEWFVCVWKNDWSLIKPGIEDFIRTLLSTQKKEMIKKIMNDEELWEYLRNPIHISVKNRIEYVLQKMKEGE